MKTTVASLLASLVMLLPMFAVAETKSSEAELQDMYVSFLLEEGYRPEVDQDGDVVFKREGRTYFIAVNAEDPGFFQLVLPNIWPIESEAERVQVLVAADYSNATSKASKVFIMEDDVWVDVEFFVSPADDFADVFERCIRAIGNGVSMFVKDMQRQQEQQAPVEEQPTGLSSGV
jgi:hypothetical protein